MLEGISLRRVAVIAVLAPLLAAAGKTAAKPAAKKASTTAGPGLKDSIAFLKEKLETYGTYAYDVEKKDPPEETGKVTGSAKISSFDEKSCVLQVRRQVDLETVQKDDESHTYSEMSEIDLRIPLRDLDPTKVSVENLPTTFRKVYESTGDTSKFLQVTVVGKDEKAPIKISEKRTMKDPTAEKKSDVAKVTDQVPTTYLMFSDADVSERAQKALQHAIELCQKKKEAF